SQFANIGNPHNEIFDVHDVLTSLSLLYGSTPQLHFEWNPVPQRVIIFADKTQVNRLFTNLLQNAVEAAAHRNPAVVKIWEETEGSYIRINIQDNGEGIAADMLSKIFTPNFTTKTSGTGLGLAMCKSIVENIQGEIGFQTELGAGSTFYVRLPMFR
ncbi:MAG: sensor histidine kinase, partial [Chitinophagaceae bacterium]